MPPLIAPARPGPSRLRHQLATLALLAFTNVGLGWHLGFRSVNGYIVFWLLVGLAGVTAVRIVHRVFPSQGLADAIVRIGIVFFALVVLVGLALGSFGLLGTAPYLAAFAIGFGVSLALDTPGESHHWRVPNIPVHIVGLLLPLLILIVAIGIVQSPLTLYDSLSYHLFFPARWLQEHRISIIQTPFSDPAQAYQPGNGELFFLWLMIPFHGDLMARIGQFPFLLLGGAALYAIARRSGARPEHAVYAPTLYFLARPVVEQAVGADVDLICAATFVTSLYLGIVAVDSDQRRDWLIWGISLGLYLGTKYLALVYVPVVLLLPLVRGPRLRAIWALPGIALLAFPWYLRNWVIAGSPIYPASLNLMGVNLARGAFTHQAMNNSVFHVTSVRLLPVIAAHAFGTPVFLFWLPGAVLGALCLSSRRRWWPAGYVLLVPLFMVPLNWFGIPDNADSRFLLPAVTCAMVSLSFAFGGNRVWNACVHALWLFGIGWILVGTGTGLDIPLPWFMRDWLSLEGLVHRDFLGRFVVAGGVAAGLAFFLSRHRSSAAPTFAAVFGAGCLAVAIGSTSWCTPGHCSPLTLSPTYIRAGMLKGWEWVEASIGRSAIAYTGNNVPYPLFGDHLTNRVFYVNIDRHASWRFHDYARARRQPGLTQYSGSPLARPSGQLMPVAGPGQEASRPRYERREGLRDAWIENLASAGVDHLFVSALSAYEIDYVWHNDQGFPIEDDWARADPQAFRLVFENGEVRIYATAFHP